MHWPRWLGGVPRRVKRKTSDIEDSMGVATSTDAAPSRRARALLCLLVSAAILLLTAAAFFVPRLGPAPLEDKRGDAVVARANTVADRELRVTGTPLEIDDVDASWCRSVGACAVECANVSSGAPGELAANYVRNHQAECSELVSLTLSNCSFPEATLRRGWLPLGELSLRRLTLTRGNLAHLDHAAFADIRFVDLEAQTATLELDRLRVASLSTGCFEETTGLQTLRVSANALLSQIDADLLAPLSATLSSLAFTECPSPAALELIGNLTDQSTLPSLLVLDLRFNPALLHLSRDVLRGVPRLRSLYFSSLRSVDRSALRSVASTLQLLHLADNLLEALEEGTLDGLLEIGPAKYSFHMALARNPWRCDCALQWLQLLMRAHPNVTLDEPKCGQWPYEAIRDADMCESQGSTSVTLETTSVEASTPQSTTPVESTTEWLTTTTTTTTSSAPTIPTEATTGSTLPTEATSSRPTTSTSTTQSTLPTEPTWHTTLPTEPTWHTTLPTEPTWHTTLPTEPTWHTTLPTEPTWHTTLPTASTVPSSSTVFPWPMPTATPRPWIKVICEEHGTPRQGGRFARVVHVAKSTGTETTPVFAMYEGNVTPPHDRGRFTRSLLATEVAFPWSGDFSVHEDAVDGGLLVDLGALTGTLLLMDSADVDDSTSHVCVARASGQVAFRGVRPASTYTLCLLTEDTDTVTDGDVVSSPFDCRAVTTQPERGKRPWLLMQDQKVVLGVGVAVAVACGLTCAVAVFLLVRAHPHWLRGSERVVVVKHRTTDKVLVLPPATPTSTSTSTSTSSSSSTSPRASKTSYVSAVEPTSDQLKRWRRDAQPPPPLPPRDARRSASPSRAASFDGQYLGVTELQGDHEASC